MIWHEATKVCRFHQRILFKNRGNDSKSNYLSRTSILNCSDEPEKAFEELNYLETFADVKVSHANLESDFIMMAKFCDNIVFSRGTFAWWVYLKKAKVYYRDEFENNYLSIDVNRNLLSKQVDKGILGLKNTK